MIFDVIGITGLAHSDKDIVSNYICKKYNFIRHGPSSYVKRATAAMFNIPEEYLYDKNKKDTVDPFWQMTYRQMAQKVGKECSRDIFGQDFWMRHVGKHLTEFRKIVRTDEFDTKGIILPDIKYENEIDFVHNWDGIVISVKKADRPLSTDDNHPAARGIPDYLVDAIITINDSKEVLYEQVDSTLVFLQKHKQFVLAHKTTRNTSDLPKTGTQ